MKIEQFYDESLAHGSYAILSGGEIALVDPARDPQPYYDFAAKNNARIVAVFETHPHADFVSSHYEISKKTGAKIYVSKLLGAEYPHETFDEGDEVKLGDIKLKALNTPGHSPDSISIIAEDETGKDMAIFTGDTLFVGDVGRPDLRESAGKIMAKREELARDMYRTTREKLFPLDDEILVYPAHGAGSLCGKNLSDERSSNMGKEKRENWAFQEMTEDEFVDELLNDQPFIPKYFTFDVGVNKMGAPDFEESISKINRITSPAELDRNLLVIDVRPARQFKKGHLKGSINIPNIISEKYETWLGSIVGPNEFYYLVAEDEQSLKESVIRAAKIGYEVNIKGAALFTDAFNEISESRLDLDDFIEHSEKYTIIDIRSLSERLERNYFEDSLHIPLESLREKANLLQTDRPIVVHCAGGYRSAAGASILKRIIKNVDVFDLSRDIKRFRKKVTA